MHYDLLHSIIRLYNLTPHYFSRDVLHPSGPCWDPLSLWEDGGGRLHHGGGHPRQEGRLDRHPPLDPGGGPGDDDSDDDDDNDDDDDYQVMTLAMDPTNSALPLSPIFIRTSADQGGGAHGHSFPGLGLDAASLLDNLDEITSLPHEFLNIGRAVYRKWRRFQSGAKHL